MHKGLWLAHHVHVQHETRAAIGCRHSTGLRQPAAVWLRALATAAASVADISCLLLLALTLRADPAIAGSSLSCDPSEPSELWCEDTVSKLLLQQIRSALLLPSPHLC